MKLYKIIYTISICVGIMFLGSCSKDFLDRKPYDSLPSGEAIKTPDDMQVALNGMYAGLRNVDLYGRTLPVIGDLLADNSYVSTKNSGRYIPFFDYSYTKGNGDISGIWNSAYDVILRANNIINADITGDAVPNLKGQAKAIRALVYFELIRHFAKPYSVAPDGLGVPVILKFDPTVYPERNTVKEVYTQIVTDLKDAIGTLDDVNENSSYMGKWAAEGLLAKVYLYMDDWANALTSAKDVIDNSGFQPVTGSNILAYWQDDQPDIKGETLFEVSFTSTENLSTNSLNYMYQQEGYGDLLCSDELYNLYSATDVRKKLIIDSVRGGSNVHVVNKYFYANSTDKKDDTKILRMAEVKLILAEAYAHTPGGEVNALTLLNELAIDRDPDFTGYTSTGGALIDDIINERRKELAFEGDRYYDFYRLGRTVQRNSAEYPNEALELKPDDTRRILPIPVDETDANPNITPNPGY